jgi:hypothetical protein
METGNNDHDASQYVDQNHHNPEQARTAQGRTNEWLVGAKLDFSSAPAKATVTMYLELPSVWLLHENFARGATDTLDLQRLSDAFYSQQRHQDPSKSYLHRFP